MIRDGVSLVTACGRAYGVGSSALVLWAICPRKGKPGRGWWLIRWQGWFECRAPPRSAIVGMVRSSHGDIGCPRRRRPPWRIGR